MPTKRQINFVDDIESAMKALKGHQGVDKPTVSQLRTHAGIPSATFLQIINRLKDNKEKELLGRLYVVLSQCKKIPKIISDVDFLVPGVGIPEQEEIIQQASVHHYEISPSTREELQQAAYQLDRSMPVYSNPTIGYPIAPNPQDALVEVLSIIRPFQRHERERIISAASMFYGVGE